MTATQEKYLNTKSAIIEVVRDPGTLTAILDDFSNAEAVKTEIDALTFKRLSSVTDLSTVNDFSDQLKIEADDNAIIYNSTQNVVTVTGNYYEIGNPDVLEEMLGEKIVNGTGNQIVGDKIGTKSMPRLIVRITSSLAGWKVKQIYVRDMNFIGQLTNAFADINRVGGLPSSPFEFQSNKWGDYFTYTDDLPA